LLAWAKKVNTKDIMSCLHLAAVFCYKIHELKSYIKCGSDFISVYKFCRSHKKNVELIVFPSAVLWGL
jgi:hypothetical protein